LKARPSRPCASKAWRTSSAPFPGVVEDATDIILNLKQVPFKMMGEGIRSVRLKADSAGEVMSGQIETDADIEVLDRNMHIATIGPGGKLSIEMRLKSGRGYVSADRNNDEDLPWATFRSIRCIRPSAR
jgi:DNA-directed RNA polymerase subunit alpha